MVGAVRHRLSGLIVLVGLLAMSPGAAAAPISLPRDHAAHPERRIEWWYFTGRLRGEQMGEVGFQFTLFRTRMPPGNWSANPSAFTPHQLFLGHAALSRLSDGTHRQDHRLARGGLALAAASEQRLDLQVADWSLVERGGRWQARFSVGDERFELDFGKPGNAVLHGDNGLSAKAAVPGYTSHYYSLPRMVVSGTRKDAADSEAISGVAWMDHEWSDALLHPDAAGWDWFGLRLAGGESLMAFRIRSQSGEEVFRTGTLVSATGEARTLLSDALKIEPLGRTWQSPDSGALYPMRWRLTVGGRALLVEAEFEAQEMTGSPLSPTYWKGVVRVSGAETGEGYMELTGYGAPLFDR